MGKRKRTPVSQKGDDNEKKTKKLRSDSAVQRQRSGSEVSSSASAEESLSDAVSLKTGINNSNDWNLWGPYLSERQWGTVREDTSKDGNCWESFPHSQAASRCYLYGEDGLFGWSDEQAELCLSLALWNGKDPMLKERLYGMTGPQGNHGEDVKECYYYLKSTPQHSYMSALYKYPVNEFPYDELLEENTGRTAEDPEYEVMDTGVFNNREYFDVFCKYVKRSARDMFFEYIVHNRSDAEAHIDILPQIWFRNTWSGSDQAKKPKIQKLGENGVLCVHPRLGKYIFEYDASSGNPQRLYTENETNPKCLKKATQLSAASTSKQQKQQRMQGFKDAFQCYLVEDDIPALNTSARGTKFGVHYNYNLQPGQKAVVRCRLVYEPEAKAVDFSKAFDRIVSRAEEEHAKFYKQILPKYLNSEEKLMAVQAYAGLCWNKQYFGYDVSKWMNAGSRNINQSWRHMINSDVISMPDKWEFPWYATWDLAFHMIPLADLDMELL